MLMEFCDAYAKGHHPYKGGRWCYEDGLVYRGLELLHRATGEERWLDHLKRLIAPQLIDGPNLLGYDANEYNIDNILSGRALLYLHEVTGDDAYLKIADLLAEQLRTHPRTKSGVYWHKLRYPWQVWLDGLYMGPPFQIAYGLRTNQPELVKDAINQISIALDMTYVEGTRLYAHAVDEARKQPWANPETGLNAAHWARAIGWLAMALVDVADMVSAEDFAPLAKRTEDLLAEVARCRQPNGLWLQVMDQPDLEGNYEESSASAMFVYALVKGQQLGLWQGDSQELVDTLMTSVLKPNAEGRQEMIEICHVAGLGMYENRFRDGSAEYYLTETRVSDDTKGVGPLMGVIALAHNLSEPQEVQTRAVG
jgi:unsaturated rhamnogalacturonyl hydrolase